ncbi:hypothetical protein PVAND_016928 [Polypedilum vanderplanki]|uniref:Odorant receptor n=1 Tax=Polypedilum vanderplanki TaxID=319348 RepID=A0A9J6BH41_POLVA|nr:hypothetical protein PVAND_016928 [Polypedilum vanderplanki]
MSTINNFKEPSYSIPNKMFKIEKLFQNFIVTFQKLGLFPTENKLKPHIKIILLCVFVMCEILPLILMPLKLIQEPTSDQIIHTLMLTGGFFWQLLFNLNFVITRSKLMKFTQEYLKIVCENQLAIPFVYEACVKAKRVLKIMCILSFISVNFQVFLLPLAFGILPIPMYQPSWTTSGFGFVLLWFYQLLLFNYAAKSAMTLVLSYVFVILVTVYAKFLSSELQNLSSSSNWMNEYKNLIKCIRIHLQIKKMMNDWTKIYGVIIGFMLMTLKLFVAACIFLSTHGDEKLAFKESVIFSVMILASTGYQFIPCYCGSSLLSITENFSYDLYSSDWTDGNLKYKKAMIIFCENLKKPISMSVFGYKKLTMEVFSEVG